MVWALVGLDGYFEGMTDPDKYASAEVHTNEPVEEKITDLANEIRINLSQTSLAYEFNNHLVLPDNGPSGAFSLMVNLLRGKRA
jgi:hypothetical protein